MSASEFTAMMPAALRGPFAQWLATRGLVAAPIPDGDPVALVVVPKPPPDDAGRWRCPRCLALTPQLDDRIEGYCGRCHDWTGADAGRHFYVSTACIDGFHEECRQVCKFCAQPCGCTVCGHGG